MAKRLKLLLVLPLLALILSLVLVSQESVQVGYTVVTGNGQDPAPAGAALFSFSNLDGILISEAGVAATVPLARGRIFVDQRGTNTGVALVNPDNSAIGATLTLRNQSGQQVSEFDRTFQPGEHFAANIGQPGFFQNTPNNFVGSLSFEVTNSNRGLAAITIRQGTNSRNETLFATLPVAELSEGAVAGNADTSMIFPHLGAGEGLSTQIILIERSGQASTGTVQLIGTDGNPLEFLQGGVSTSEFSYSLAANGVFETELTAAGDVRQGYAVVTSQSGTLPEGTAVFRFQNSQAPITEAGVAAIPPTRRARIFVDNNNTRTGVAVAVPAGLSSQGNQTTVEVRFDLLDRNGNLIESTTLDLTMNGQTAIFVDELFPALPNNFNGLMEISSDDPIVPITLKFTVNSRNEFVLTTLPVADLENPTTANQVIFPQVGFGLIPGLGNFGTRLIFIAPSDSLQSRGSLLFRQTGGGGAGVPLIVPLGEGIASDFTYEIEAGGALQLLPGVAVALASIAIDETSLTVNQGASIGLNPILLDEDGNVRQEFPLNFTTLDPAVVTVDEQGTLTGVSRGFSTVTVETQGIVVTVTVTVATITAGANAFNVDGIAQDQTQVVYLASSSNHTLLRTADLANDAPTVWAGQPGISGLRNNVLEQARFNGPRFLALDESASRLYVSDSANHVVRSVETVVGGRVTTLAGDGTPGFRDGALANARFNRPQGLAIDQAGRIWLADSENHVIRLIDLASGQVSTVAGMAGTPGNRDGSGTAARFRSPQGLSIETEPLDALLQRQAVGLPPPPVSVIVADTGNNLLRRVFETGEVESLTAFTATGLSPQGAVPATFKSPAGVAVDSFGNIYFSEPSTSRVRILLRTGEVVQAAQSGTFDSPVALAISNRGRAVVAERSRSAQEIRYAGPSIASVSPAQVSNQGGARVTITGRNLAPDSLVVIGGTVISNPGFINTGTLSFVVPELPSGEQTLTVQHRGGLAQANLFVDATPLSALDAGEITTLAGGSTFSGDGRLATAAVLATPTDVVIDSIGRLYVASPLAHRVRRIDPVTRIITTVAGIGTSGSPVEGTPAIATEFHEPSGLALDDGDNLYIADRGIDAVYRVDALSGLVSRVAGIAPAAFVEIAGNAPSTALINPTGMVVGPDSELYLTASGQNRVYRVAPQGDLQLIAGTGSAGYSGDGGPATSARFSDPRGLALDEDLRLYVADLNNQVVRRIDLNTGLIETFAGTGMVGYTGDGGPAAQARLNLPADLTFDAAGNLLIADAGNGVIRSVRSNGTISTIPPLPPAAIRAQGSSPLTLPVSVATGTGGSVFVGDFLENRVFRVTPEDDFYQVYAGSGELTVVGDGAEATRANLSGPEGLALGPDQDIFIADTLHNRIRKVSGVSSSSFSFLAGAGTTYSSAVISTIAGTGVAGFSGDGAAGALAQLNHPTALSFLSDGDLLISDTFSHRLRKLESGPTGLLSFLRLGNSANRGVISTFAGNGENTFGGDGGPATGASLNFPTGTSLDAQGRVYLADAHNNRIRRINRTTGIITTVFGTGLNRPEDVVVDGSGDLLVADTGNNRILKVDLPSGQTQVIAGADCLVQTCLAGYNGDEGPANQANLSAPSRLALDGAGNLYVADRGNHRIRRISTSGSITTIAGTGTPGFAGDNGPATNAQFNGVAGLAFDADGNLFLLDQRNGRLRAIKGAGQP